MTLDDLNGLLSEINKNPESETVFSTARFLVHYMGLHLPGDEKEQGIAVEQQGLKKYLVSNSLTRQGLLFRFTEEGQNVRIILGVLKKFRKDHLTQLIDKENLICFQKNPPFIQGRPSAKPYLLYFVTTESFDRLYVILFNENQKRIICLRNKLTPTQFNKILPQWENIGQKSKPEIAAQLWKSLDLKEVNKEFYKQIKEQFDALVEMAVQQAPKANEKDIKQFAVRLIGRYIFCWFLKEKGIIPDDLLGSEAVKDSEDYLKKVLQPLFFKTLNTPVPERDFLKSADSVLQKLASIPYLNGGLFDRHAEDNLFSQLKLNDWLYSFVQVLENFDFTVDESSSQYQLVSIDPEMLGRIFENLLASQNEETEKLANQRKAFGAFYTPREIVDYMVNESLKAYLETHLLPKDPKTESSNRVEDPAVAYKGTLFQQLEPQQILIPFGNKEKIEAADRERIRKNLQTKIDKLFAVGCTDNPFDKDETAKVRKLLSEITVLDPACGSGAFPMGMMLRLMEVRQIVGHGYRNNYDLKSEILSKNIYGVDIMSMAVEIARLRAWLSLVLEAEYKPQDRKNNFGIAALPNLDFKFICANSLIDSGYDAFLEKVPFNATLYRMDGEIQKLERLRADYYDPKGDRTKKKDLQTDFYKTKTYIKTEFDGLKKAWKLEDFLSKVDDWDPFDDGKPSSFFSPAWMFGIREGFDVVIGNPPYVQLQKIDAERKKQFMNQQYETYESTGDLYQLFYERGIKILKEKGVISYITSNKWMRANYGIGTRTFFAKNTLLLSVVDFGMTLVFETATILTNIFIARKDGRALEIPICRTGDDFKNPALLTDYVKAHSILIDNPGGNSWIAYSKEEYELIKMIEEQGIPLKDWDIQINYGIKTGCNEAFIINREQRDAIVAEDAKSAEIIRPILRGEDIKAYVPAFADLYLIATFPALSLNIDKYKGIKKHLEKFRKQIEPKPRNFKGEKWIGRKSGAYEWFETQDSISYYKDFEKPKIIYPNMTKYLPFVYDEKVGYVSNDKSFILTGEHLKYLTGVFNSTLWKFAFKDRFPELLGETRELRKVFFDKIPIKKTTGNFEKLISEKVDEIIERKNKKGDTSSLEREIDGLVYKLYNLTYEEVKVVDKDFWMGEEEYNSFKVQ